MVTSSKYSGRFLDDKESWAALVDGMGHELRAEFNRYGFAKKQSGFPGRVLVVYKLQANKPVVLDQITLKSILVQHTGPVVSARSGGQGDYPITTTPSKWRGLDLFLYAPQNFIFKWVGKYLEGDDVEFAPHYAIIIKTRTREDEQIEGHTYCATLNEFRERFPGVPVRY